MTILMRLDTASQSMDQDELKPFMEWLRGVGVDPAVVRACAIESPDAALASPRYLLHLAEHRRVDGKTVWDPATYGPQLIYRTVELHDGWTWPTVRATPRESWA